METDSRMEGEGWEEIGEHKVVVLDTSRRYFSRYMLVGKEHLHVDLRPHSGPWIHPRQALTDKSYLFGAPSS